MKVILVLVFSLLKNSAATSLWNVPNLFNETNVYFVTVDRANPPQHEIPSHLENIRTTNPFTPITLHYVLVNTTFGFFVAQKSNHANLKRHLGSRRRSVAFLHLNSKLKPPKVNKIAKIIIA